MIAATVVNLEAARRAYLLAEKSVDNRIVVCAGTGCMANGSMAVYEALRSEIERAGLKVVTTLDVHDCSGHEADKCRAEGGCTCGDEKKDGGLTLLSRSGCQGFCQMGPLVTLHPSGLFYCGVKAADAAEIVERTLKGGEVVERLLYVEPGTDHH